MNIVSMRRRLDGKVLNGIIFQKYNSENLAFKFYDQEAKEWKVSFIEAFEPIV